MFFSFSTNGVNKKHQKNFVIYIYINMKITEF